MQYTYDIEYRETSKFGNADGLFRLPNPETMPRTEEIRMAETISALCAELRAKIPIPTTAIAQEVDSDSKLSQVKEWIRDGFPVKVRDPDLKMFAQMMTNLTVHQGCIWKDERIYIPEKFHNRILDLLHESHFGWTKMKALARGVPNNANNAPRQAQKPQKCLCTSGKRLETCGSVIVDAKSKWPEVVRMKSTTTRCTIKALQDVFRTFGIPEQIVSDNGPQFMSSEFLDFCSLNGIKQLRTAPYHPQSNGEAERFVQTFKKALAKNVKDHSVDDSVHQLLVDYRSMPHAAIQKSPAEAMFGRRLRTKVTMNGNLTVVTYRDRMQAQFDQHTKEKSFQAGDDVWLRSYVPSDEKWIAGRVIHLLGNVMCAIQTVHGTLRRHFNQMKHRVHSKYSSAEAGSHGQAENTRQEPNSVPQPARVPRITTPVPQVRERPQRKRKAPERYSPTPPLRKTRTVRMIGTIEAGEKLFRDGRRVVLSQTRTNQTQTSHTANKPKSKIHKRGSSEATGGTMYPPSVIVIVYAGGPQRRGQRRKNRRRRRHAGIVAALEAQFAVLKLVADTLDLLRQAPATAGAPSVGPVGRCSELGPWPNVLINISPLLLYALVGT
ncbi:hypothetical protein L596_028868 [Steinernema carpocapsae]|uniref:Integrase catalytic domain-containing protein n=1 Tax=Steinernema carpocapsae TaxID=34508 RepID=A0A4U5LZS0_STECR|nr:hypothetical protein L596_028868 [Steinernema carpocapsae]